MVTPLNGIRILDLGKVWAGPLAGRILAQLGAEVITISTRKGFVPPEFITEDISKRLGVFPNNDPGKSPWNRASGFNDLGRNKIGLSLEMNEEGIKIFKELVKVSDVVLENFSPRVMGNWGLDYTSLKEINPKIILCSMSGYGHTGPYRDRVSYGSILEPHLGLASLMGYPDGGPRLSGNSLPDPVAAIHAACAILMALIYQNKTGKGQHIDLSQAESLACVIGEIALEYAISKNIPNRLGNRTPCAAPHNAFQCKGEDKWVAISVSSDEEWRALATIMGMPSLGSDERFRNLEQRKKNEEVLEEIVRKWTSDSSHIEIMEALQSAGVPAGAVLNAPELLSDKHLNFREYFDSIDHPEAGCHRYPRLPIRFSKSQLPLPRRAPVMGEHNEYVLKEILEFEEEKIKELEEKGIIGKAPIFE